jgi:hypothetical protein
MIDYRNASAYCVARQKYLLSEAEALRLLQAAKARKTKSPWLILWVGDLLIATGLKLKAAYQLDASENMKPANFVQSTSKAHK